jgi:hypothetical protein
MAWREAAVVVSGDWQVSRRKSLLLKFTAFEPLIRDHPPGVPDLDPHIEVLLPYESWFW